MDRAGAPGLFLTALRRCGRLRTPRCRAQLLVDQTSQRVAALRAQLGGGQCAVVIGVGFAEQLLDQCEVFGL
jgi:hypothetical protein